MRKMKGKETLSLPCAQAEQSVGSDVPVTGGQAGRRHLQRDRREGTAQGDPGAHGAAVAPGEEGQQGDQAAEGEWCLLGTESLRLPLRDLASSGPLEMAS